MLEWQQQARLRPRRPIVMADLLGLGLDDTMERLLIDLDLPVACCHLQAKAIPRRNQAALQVERATDRTQRRLKLIGERAALHHIIADRAQQMAKIKLAMEEDLIKLLAD